MDKQGRTPDAGESYGMGKSHEERAKRGAQ